MPTVPPPPPGPKLGPSPTFASCKEVYFLEEINGTGISKATGSNVSVGVIFSSQNNNDWYSGKVKVYVVVKPFPPSLYLIPVLGPAKK